MVPQGRYSRAWAVYAALADYVTDLRLEPHAIGMTYRRIADLAGLDAKSTAQRAVQDAQRLGLIAVLDRGQPVKGGLCSLFALVGIGETIDTAVAQGTESDAFQQRVRDRESRGLGLPTIWQNADAALGTGVAA